MSWRDWFKKARGENPILTAGVRPLPVEVFGDVDAEGVFHAPHFFDHATNRSAATGTLKAWHVPAGRSIVSGQRVCDIETEIGVIPVRTRSNGNLAEILAPVGAEVSPGKPLWRVVVSRQAFQ